MSINPAEDREAELFTKWYATLPSDLRRKLSLYDFKRLGETFKSAFGLDEETEK